MARDLETQLVATADSSGVATGLQPGKKALKDFGVTATTEGAKAATALDGVGKGSESASKRVDRSTKGLIQSIQRTTATLEAGGRANVKYFETLATQRGVDVGTLRPYLDQLDQVSAKQAAASVELAKGATQFTKYGISARQNAAALRQVPAQLTDIIVGLQGGQAPLTVLLQQGGQLRDVFGGVVPAVRALGGAVLNLVNPYTVAAGAVVGLLAAYNQGSKEADTFAKALILTGNASGTTVGQLTAMAQRIDGVVGTQAQASAALAEFAANGEIAGDKLERFATVALRAEKLTGQAVKETVKQFAELGRSPVDAAVKLNETTRFLTQSLYEQIRALENQGRIAEAAAVAQQGYADALDGRLDQVAQRLGYVERGWSAIKNGAAEAWDAMLNVGRADTLEDRLITAQQRLARELETNQGAGRAPRTVNQGRVQEIQAEIDTLKESIRLSGVSAERRRAEAGSVKARIEFDKEADKYLTRREQLEREIARITEIADKAGASRVAREKLIASIREKYKVTEEDALFSKIFADGRAVFESVLTPAEKLSAEMERLDGLVTVGAIDWGTYERATIAVQDRLSGVTEAFERMDAAAFADGQSVFESVLTPAERLSAEMDRLEGLVTRGAISWETYERAVEKANGQSKLATDVGMTIATSFEDAIINGEKLRETIQGLAKDILRLLIRQTVTQPLALQLGRLFNSTPAPGGGTPLPTRANGGPVSSGTTYLVGERGPELFTPKQSGAIVPNNMLAGASAPRTQPMAFTNVYNIDARADRAELLQLVDRSVREGNAQLVDQLQRQGRL